ncbi:MAG: hypothetical protein V4717_20555 [Bacteroidota bacterium]
MRKFLLPLLFCASILCFSLASKAQNIWTGATSVAWNTATNWSTGAVPTTADDVIIPPATNKPVINTTGAVAKTVEVHFGAILTIQNSGSLAVNGSRNIHGFTTAFNNSGTVANSGSLIIGNVSAVGDYGLWNENLFNNNTGGQISINYAREIGLYNTNGTFTNAATISIGATVNVGITGLENRANFYNNTGGQISIDQSATYGLKSVSGTFQNAAAITIGSVASVGSNGLWNQATFTNTTGGQISIDRSTQSGLRNLNGNGIFDNAGAITIGAVAGVGTNGLWNEGAFTNNTGGQISIDRSTFTGLYNYFNSFFANAGAITIGAVAGVGNYGVLNTATFNNSGCAALLRIVSNNIVDGGPGFNNASTVIENASGNSNIGINTGLVQNLNGGTFTITNNSGIITTTSVAIWKGCTSAAWNTSTNWSNGTVPTTADDVIIPPVTNQPVISTPGAVAKTIEVQFGSTLTIQSSGSLAVNGSRNIHGFTTAFNNSGTVANSGSLLIGNISAVGNYGLWNEANFDNNPGGQISIDYSNEVGLNNTNGTFNNAAVITIGAVAGAGITGLENKANFNNSSGGQISINRTQTYGLKSSAGTFQNAAAINIGAVAGVGSNGLWNQSTFNNTTGGQIGIDRSTQNGFRNLIGNGIVNNAGTITIGAVAGVGEYGLRNEGAFTNNTGGQISIDRSTFTGLNNALNTFTNTGAITIGAVAGVGTYGVLNQATFNNSSCATLLRIVSNSIVDGGPGFSNSGTVIENASGNSNIGTNTGLVQNLNGGTFTVTTNTGTLTANSGTIWKGCTSTAWTTATNWSNSAVPTTTDDVIIFPATNQPVISNAGAVAKTVEVQFGTKLTIQSSGSLAVNGLRDINGFTTAFYNNGTVWNSGELLIGNVSGKHL